MTRPYDLERGLAEIAEARAFSAGNGDLGQSITLGDQLADGIRGDFDTTLDMESVGAALVIAAASLIGFRGVPPIVTDILGLAGENLVTAARARATEAREVEGVLCEHVLTWHPVDAPDDAPGVEIPLYQHIELPSGFGELRSHSREVPPPVELTKYSAADLPPSGFRRRPADEASEVVSPSSDLPVWEDESDRAYRDMVELGRPSPEVPGA